MQLPGGTAFKQLPASRQATLLPLTNPAKVERLAQRALTKEPSVRELREIVGAEVSLSDPEAPFRGRPPVPQALTSLHAISRQLKDDGGRSGWNRSELDSSTRRRPGTR